MKATIIGGGNIGMALAEGLIQAGKCKATDITITRRTMASVEGLRDKAYEVSADNAEAIKKADAIFVCVLPQQLDTALSTWIHRTSLRFAFARQQCAHRRS